MDAESFELRDKGTEEDEDRGVSAPGAHHTG